MISFLLKKNKHYSNNWFYKLRNLFWENKSKISAYVSFTDSCIYSINSKDQLDINKLFGVSFGFFGIHKNSARFGWNYDNKLNRLNLYSYCYVDGKRQYCYLESIKPNIRYSLIIKTFFTDKALFTIINCDTNKILVQKYTSINKTKNWGIRLWPYFGGNIKSPQDITINLQING